MKNTYWVYDIETFSDVFTFTIVRQDKKFMHTIEISKRKNEIDKLVQVMDYLIKSKHYMVGFNNVNFDYPVVHQIYNKKDKLNGCGKKAAKAIYALAQKQIESSRFGGFPNTVRAADVLVNQVDLLKIWHFDNKAKMTSLKALEFNMRCDTIEDLPFDHAESLESDQIDVLIDYNQHDVWRTLDFFDASKSQIEFREELTEKYNRDFMNHNDTKIGKDYFIMRLEEYGIRTSLKDYTGQVVTLQSKRSVIDIGKCLFRYYDFKRPEFKAVLDWFATQRIKETKGVFTEIPEHKLGEVAKYAELITKRKKFIGQPSEEDIEEFKKEYPLGWVEQVELKAKKKGQAQYSYWMNWKIAENLNVVVNGFRFDFGTGGIHGSVTDKIVRKNKYLIRDCDVSSMYPNLAIANRVYPEHLGEKFCDIYEDVYEQRKLYKKGTVENGMLKLALNGVYGDSNNQFSPFYDPQYTMTITVNGQLSLCLLAERLLNIPSCELIQVNTDGVTVKILPEDSDLYYEICKGWEETTRLQLEYVDYSAMFIKNVNNYVAVYDDEK